jgi:hypothetical protein
MGAVRIGSKHCRAICEEVGERLRQHIDRTTASPSQRILELLRAIELLELEAPSIVPSLEDLEVSVSVFASMAD